MGSYSYASVNNHGAGTGLELTATTECLTGGAYAYGRTMLVMKDAVNIFYFMHVTKLMVRMLMETTMKMRMSMKTMMMMMVMMMMMMMT